MRLIVFDVDGTLVDSAHNIVAAMEEAFLCHQITPPSKNSIKGIIGLSLEKAIESLLSPKEEGKLALILTSYKEIYQKNRQHSDYYEPLFDGAREILESLDSAGYLLGIATGKSRRGLNVSLARHGIENYFISKKTADDAPSKPHPQMLEEIIRESGSDPHHTLMVGDSVFDMQMACNAQVRGIGVAWGCHSVKALKEAGARTIAKDFPELAVAIEGLMD